MHTPAQEGIAQLLFWSGIGSLPGSIGVFIAAFGAKSRIMGLTCLVAGGALLTHFLWYFRVLGISLATKVGRPVFPSWWYFAPLGFGLAFMLTIFWLARTLHGTPET